MEQTDPCDVAFVGDELKSGKISEKKQTNIIKTGMGGLYTSR